ncbi:hypothetical protein ASE37_22995 [Rhizobium sp. Root268]|nr:hypothetical protein ASC86_21950 [Rhizobium sp. Root1212]KRD31624.1 hypothetical protein ASE37_22995 [Rhizobium sp. Root268]
MIRLGLPPRPDVVRTILALNSPAAGFVPRKSIIAGARANSAPGFSATGPGSREPLGNEDIAETAPISNQHAEFSTVPVFVPLRPRVNFERSAVDQLEQSFCGSGSKRKFRSAFRFIDFRRVDIGDADLLAVHPDCIAVNNACLAAADSAIPECLQCSGFDVARRGFDKRRRTAQCYGKNS